MRDYDLLLRRLSHPPAWPLRRARALAAPVRANTRAAYEALKRSQARSYQCQRRMLRRVRQGAPFLAVRGNTSQKGKNMKKIALCSCLGLLMACGGSESGSPQTAGGTLSQAPEGVTGRGAMILPKEAPILARGTSDGLDDPQLAVAMKMAGAESYEALSTLGGTDSARARDWVEGSVGLVTAKGHYLLRINPKVLAERFGGQAKVAPPGSASERGWSNAVDNRTRLTSGIPVEQGIVFGAGQCSGSLIGRRIVRTAAHCVIPHSAGTVTPVASVQFDSARNGAAFHATDTTSFFYYGGGYIGNNCGVSTATDYWSGYRANFNTCTWQDWAMLILDTNWYSQAGEPGWISWYGYKGLVSGDLGMDLTSFGYPACDDFLNGNGTNNENSVQEDPAGCRTNPNASYRDNSAKCEVGSWSSGTSKWKTGCDTNGGNSGGPVIERNTNMLIGHCQWQDCGTCAAGTNYPNTYLGHDDWLFNFQNQLRNDFP